MILAAVTAGHGQPVITQQPQSQTNAADTTATFTVEATGSPAYQWQRDTGFLDFWDLADCTNTTLVLTNVVASDAVNYRVILTTAQGAVTSAVAHLYVILPPTLQFAASSYTVAENAGTVTLTVRRLKDPSRAVTVDYATTNGTAAAGLKYTAVSGTLTFGPGETNQTIVVPILNEGFVEGTQTFRVLLSNPTGGAVLGSPTSATVLITDNDAGIQFQSATYSVTEDAGAVVIRVVRGDDAPFPVSVDFATSDLTATNGLDYAATNGTLAFAVGEQVKSFAVPILNDSLKEPAKTFRVTLSNPQGVSVGTASSATVTILDNDPGFRFESAGYTVAEDASVVLVGVLRANDGNLPTSVDFATSDLTATNGLDYVATNGTLVFAPGEKVKVITVPLLNDGLADGTEIFRITLSNPTNGVLGTPAVTTVAIWEQPVPHHFSGIAPLPDRSMVLSLDGRVANLFNLSGAVSNQFRQMFDLYVVEASTNLADWTRLALLPRTNNNPNPLLFKETNSPGLSRRFYRTFTNHLLSAFPKPSGPFAVGTVDRVMVDPARTSPYRYLPPTNAFVVTFWYPADPPGAGWLPASMWSKKLAADTSFCATMAAAGFPYADTQWTLISPKLVGHRFQGVPLASGTAKFPVVIYSHGLSSFRCVASQIAEELASHGYVVVATDHTDCWAAEFPDGRYLTTSRSGDIPARLLDMTFLVDELARLDSRNPLFAGRLDTNRIGVSGISLGGMVIETCRSDSRVKCAAIWDGTGFQTSSTGLQKPFLAALGQNGWFYSKNQWLFSMATTNAVLLQVTGADHITGTDAAWTWQIPWGCGPAQAINACFVWFFDTYLKGETPPFPTNPEIYNVQRK